MQNQHMAQMAQMAQQQNGGPDGTPVMGGMPRPSQRPPMDPREQLNTYIYDYFLRNSHFKLARAMVECDMKMATSPPLKPSPNHRANGGGGDDSADDLPNPMLPKGQLADDSFLLDWWVQFWDIYQATSNRGQNVKSSQYIVHTRNLTQMQNEQRNSRMMMTNPMAAQYQMMRPGNSIAPTDLKRTAAMNNRNPNANPMANIAQMKNPAMMASQMQRDGSNMGLNGQNPQSPGANDSAPSPNKRPRVEGAMNPGNMPGAPFNEFAQQAQHQQQQQQQQKIEAMNPGTQGSPMNQQGLEGQHDMFTGNPSRPNPGMPANAAGAPGGNHALQDYQMQLMLLEQQNKKRLLMARQEQDNINPGPNQHTVGPGFAPNMSPPGSRAGGPSPNPTEQMKRGTPKLGQQGLPGSPMPEGVMQQRNSPAPNMNFDPQLAPPGMPPQYFPQMPGQNPMIRPPSSHPGAFAGGPQMAQQQMEAAMRAQGQMPNGVWRGQPQPGMMQQQAMGVMPQNPQQRMQMPPPPAPTNEPLRPEPSPSQSNQAPPTPNQGNKAGPKKKNAKDNKPANKKGSGATPSAANGEEAPTPTASTPVAPITPHSKQSFSQGQPQQQSLPQQQQQQQQQHQQQQQAMDNIPPFGNIDTDPTTFDLNLNFGDDTAALENFDFDSFLHTDDGGGANFGLGDGFDFNAVEALNGDS